MKPQAYSVSQINAYVKAMFAQDFMLKRVCVKGEVSNCKYHSSGHIYFTVKDEKAAIAAVMFAGSRGGLSFPMREGDKVLVSGSIEVYERDGRYQLYAKEIEKDGEGSLYLKYEALKRALLEMGMFAEEYKKPIPGYIQTLGVVTAPTGAAVQDIRTIAKRRNPYVQLILYPAQVQGEGAAESIVNGIRALDAHGVDAIIVGRGGGSIEDLWAFNEEIVARAVFECETPVISAVGHETDTTIVDFVADLRAPTPSAAAELAVCDVSELLDELNLRLLRLRQSAAWKKEAARSHLEQLAKLLALHAPFHRLNEKRQRIVDAQERLTVQMERKIADGRYRIGLLAGRLDGVSPAKKLSQGFVFVTDAKQERVGSVSNVQEGDLLRLHLKDGVIDAAVQGVTVYAEEGQKG